MLPQMLLTNQCLGAYCIIYIGKYKYLVNIGYAFGVCVTVVAGFLQFHNNNTCFFIRYLLILYIPI